MFQQVEVERVAGQATTSPLHTDDHGCFDNMELWASEQFRHYKLVSNHSSFVL